MHFNLFLISCIFTRVTNKLHVFRLMHPMNKLNRELYLQLDISKLKCNEINKDRYVLITQYDESNNPF